MNKAMMNLYEGAETRVREDADCFRVNRVSIIFWGSG